VLLFNFLPFVSLTTNRFLHASLQLDAMSWCTSAQDVLETLQEFPSKIEGVYRQTWQRICGQSPKNVLLAKTILIWVLTAARSMTIEELRRAIATAPGTYKFERKRVVPAATILTICCGPITVEEETRLVRLVRKYRQYPLSTFLKPLFQITRRKTR
jgi:ankyrin repeat domain-containing protein 50